MYDELIKRLRNCATQAAPCKTCGMIEDGSCSDTLMKQAADAIEELIESNTALNGTISNLLEQFKTLSPQWISVEERLPKTYEQVLVTNGTLIHIGWLEPDYWLERDIWVGKNPIDDFGKVTHWMPLPEPPKEVDG